MAPEPKKYATFITQKGLYAYNFMPFGLTSNPSGFSRFVNKIFKDMAWNELIFHVNDVIIYAKTRNRHNEILLKFLRRCKESNLKLNAKKCEILKSRALYLGHMIRSEGLRTNPKTGEIVKNHPTPKDKKQLQSFLGTVNYYRKFIKEVKDNEQAVAEMCEKDMDGRMRGGF